MNEEFIKSIYQTVVEEGKKDYQELYEDTVDTERILDYWKNARALYHSFDEKQKSIFYDILEQTIIDTISSIFGILDGSCGVFGGNFECDVKINGISTEDDLQDCFLGFIEELEMN